MAYMVRLGPPGRGDVIHRSDCRYAVAHSNALRWVWADRQGFASIDWDALRRHGIRPCGVCHPELLLLRRQPQLPAPPGGGGQAQHGHAQLPGPDRRRATAGRVPQPSGDGQLQRGLADAVSAESRNGIPERERVDRCFESAHTHADEIGRERHSVANIRSGVQAVVYALEGVARSIRDHDDDQWALAGELRGVLNDSAVVFSAAMTDALAALGKK